MAIELAPTRVTERATFSLTVDQIERYRHEFGERHYDQVAMFRGPRAEVELLTSMHAGEGWTPERWREPFGDPEVLVVHARRTRPVHQRRTSKLSRRASRRGLDSMARSSAVVKQR